MNLYKHYIEKLAQMSQSRVDREHMTHQIIADQFGAHPHHISHKTQLIKHLGADELDHTWLAMELEDQHGITIPKGTENKWKTVGDVHKTVHKYLKKQ